MKLMIFSFIVYYVGLFFYEISCNYCIVPTSCFVYPIFIFGGTWGIVYCLVDFMDNGVKI